MNEMYEKLYVINDKLVEAEADISRLTKLYKESEFQDEHREPLLTATEKSHELNDERRKILVELKGYSYSLGK